MEAKEGDVVRVLDTPNIRYWNKGQDAIGFEFILDEEVTKRYNKGNNITSPCNRYCINYRPKDLEFVNKTEDNLYPIF